MHEFSLEVCSDLDYKGMVIDISYNMQTIASINYDKGVDHLEIQMMPFGDQKATFPLKEFLEVLEKAKKLAIQCAQDDN